MAAVTDAFPWSIWSLTYLIGLVCRTFAGVACVVLGVWEKPPAAKACVGLSKLRLCSKLAAAEQSLVFTLGAMASCSAPPNSHVTVCIQVLPARRILQYGEHDVRFWAEVIAVYCVSGSGPRPVTAVLAKRTSLVYYSAALEADI